jgi:aminomethyltransferase
MSELKRTVFYDRHVALGAKMVEFGGWEMPVFYPTGIVEEHLATRKGAGLFDVSHMGRFIVRGAGALKFLQHVLSNNSEKLNTKATGAQYTFVPTESGGAVDDAYLYLFVEDAYLLVVNAANREKDCAHFETFLEVFDEVGLIDQTEEILMLALQGPESLSLLEGIIQSGSLPAPKRNAISTVSISGAEVMVSRTGYTGEPFCFELFVSKDHALMLWDHLVVNGATPIGLGARDTLRLEAGLPLYGHELGQDSEGREIPIMANPHAKFAVSFAPLKGEFVGRAALAKQAEALSNLVLGDYSLIAHLPRTIKPVAVEGRGVAREGTKVFKDGRQVGYVTSGTMVPLWVMEGEGPASTQTSRHLLRAICLAYIDSNIAEGEKVTLEIRGKAVNAVVVARHLRNDAPPYARPILLNHKEIPA